MKTALSKRSLAFLVLCLSVLVARPTYAEQEIVLSQGELQTLERFEAANLLRAEKAFNNKQYNQAAIEYDAFTTDFSNSPLIAYAYMRMGRSLQLDHKLNKAIKTYNEVLDKYKDATKYAAAAIYYTGECHLESGEIEAAIKAWRRMVDDPAFSKTPQAASALNRLADQYLKLKQNDDAIHCFEQASIDFRDSNPESAREGIQKVIDYRVRIQPDEGKLRDFYVKVRGFEGNPIQVAADTATDKAYWTHLLRFIKERGNFEEKQAEARTAYYQYWATALEGKFGDWDDYQIDAANFRYAASKDVSKWAETLDAQFKNGKQDDNARTIKWVHVFATHKEKIAEYFGKLNLDTVTNAQLQELMRICFHEAHNPQLGKKAFEKLKLDKWNDEQKAACALNVLFGHDEQCYVDLCETISDKEYSKFLQLRYFHELHQTPQMMAKAMILTDELKTSQRFGQEAFWRRGDLYTWQNKLTEAIAAYQASERIPQSLFRVGECYAQLGKIDAAESAFHEVEFTSKDQNYNAEACWRIACLYKDNTKEYIPKLRTVLKKYPNSGQSSTAHRELEKLHVDIGGAVIDEKR